MVEQNTNEPLITLSDAAKKHILFYLSSKEEYLGVRFSTEMKGCSGYSYVVDYVKNLSTKDIKMPLSEHYWLCIDSQSYPLLKNMQVDYIRDGLNFKFVFSNPNQKGQCGCGESFSIES